MIEIEAKFKLSTEVSREQLIDKLAPKFSAPLAEKHQIQLEIGRASCRERV